MYPMISAFLFLAALTSAAPAAMYTTSPSNSSSSAESSHTCATLHVIVARGTCESSTWENGMGITYKVANMITARVHGSDSAGLVYPATGALACADGDIGYVESVTAGNAAVLAAIETYSARCPSTKFALIGYSQGGQVIGDVVCGSSEKNFGTPIPAMASTWSNKVVAAIAFGDPAFVAGQSYDRGTDTTTGGVVPRTTTAACTAFASKFRSYCNANDKYCASGNSTVVHGLYVANNGLQGSNFIVSRYNSQKNT